MVALFRSTGAFPVQRLPGVSSNRTAAENNRMKHLLSGFAILTALAIAAPVSVEAQTSGARPARPKAHATSHKSSGHSSAARASRGGMGQGGDNVANQLNGQELQRLQASSAPPPMPMPRSAPPVVDEGPRVSGGGYIAPSRPGPVSTADPSAMGPKDSGGGYIPAPTGPMPMPPPPPVGARPSGR
jgi:hypothetical protein